MKKAVFIIGVKQSGKDVVANRFLATGGYHLGKFSYKLKAATNTLAGYPDNFWETDAKDQEDAHGLMPRELITTISEAIKKRYGRSIITRMTLPAIIDASEDKDLIFSDCRFPIDELQPVIDLLGEENVTVVRVVREGVQRKGWFHELKRSLAKKGFKFKDPYYAITEVFIDDIAADLTIYNSFTLEHLKAIADDMVDVVSTMALHTTSTPQE